MTAKTNKLKTQKNFDNITMLRFAKTSNPVLFFVE